MGKGKAPQAPDPYKSADAQTQLNQNTAAYNTAIGHNNTYTPLGSQTWTQTGTDPKTGAPIWSQNVSLTPEMQQTVTNDQQAQAGISNLGLQSLGNLSANPYDRSALPAAPIHPGQTAQDAIMSRLQPEIDMQNKQFEQDMANKGIPVGSEAYMNAHRGIEQQQNDQMQQAALNGIGLDQQARQNAMNEQDFYAKEPLNYTTGLMSQSQVTLPQFQGSGIGGGNGNSPANIMQAMQNAYQGQLGNYNANVNQSNANTAALASIIAALI